MGMGSHHSETGPTRAVSVGAIHDFYSYFQSFIRDRNMYYVVEEIVKPLTAPQRVSYAELVGCCPVEWFVSHFWGSGFAHFVESLQSHAEAASTKATGAIASGGQRSRPAWRQTRYWICSFSNNQWEIDQELGHDGVYNSSFYKALMAPSCHGTLMVLDHQLLPLTRSWCLFELMQTFQRPQTSSFTGLSLGTSQGVLNDGKAPVDVVMQLSERLLQCRLQDATASNEDDKQMIDQAVREHGGFEQMDALVKNNVADILRRSMDKIQEDLGGLLARSKTKEADDSSERKLQSKIAL